MATWSHFTAYLDGSRPITAAERDELWANYELALTACDGTHTLDATLLATLKASELITDLTPLKISGASAGTVDLSKTIATVTSSVFSPSGSSALGTAATAEGLSSPDYDALFDATTRARATTFDDYRIWNVLKRCIDALACSGSAPLPVLKVRTASGSKTKCGFDEFGPPSTPPKKYLVKTYSGVFTDLGFSGPGATTTYSGAETYSGADCSSYADTTQLDVNDPANGCSGTINNFISSGVPGYGAPSSVIFTVSTASCPPTVFAFVQCSSPDFKTDTSATVQTWTMPGAGGCFPNATGTVTVTLSSEYTNAILRTNAVAAIGSFSSWSMGTVGATTIGLYDLDSDQLTATVKQGEYYFEIPALGVAPCYKLTWNEVYAPASGAPTTTPRSYLWNGTDTVTPTLSIAVPSTPITVYLSDLLASYSCV